MPPAQAAACRVPDLRDLQRPSRHQRLTGYPPVRVAVDLLGGDHSPDVVVDGVLSAVADDPALQPILVGPPDAAQQLLAARGAVDRVQVVAASQVIAMDEDPVRGVRAKRDATVRVAARLVHDGKADALVSVGSTGATMAAALFTLGRLPGVTRPALAVVIDASAHPVVLLDVGATVEGSPDLLAQFALAGAAFARVRLGLDRPRLGLLSVGSEDRKGDAARREAYDAIAGVLDGIPATFVGNVEGHEVPLGGRADVVVTDGLTGNVLLKGLEGMIARIGAGLADAAPGDETVRGAFAQATAPMHPDHVGGAILLGVNGVVLVGHGASSPPAVAACIAAAAEAARADVVAHVAATLGDFVERRRAASGLPAAAERR
ncbi:MAG: phosphate acyltransferase PlsX [Actinomycetes bacterium]